MDIKLIALDLDGTLFSDERVIMPETFAALENAAAHGVEIVAATGRNIGIIPQAVRDAGFFKYAICSNGAAVYRLEDNAVMAENLISPRLAADIYDDLRSFEVSVQAYIDGNSYKDDSQRGILERLGNKELIAFLKRTTLFCDDLRGYIADSRGVQKFILDFIPTESGWLDRDKAVEYFHGKRGVTAVCGGGSNLEVTAEGVNKGSALKMLCGRLDIETAQTVAFGDSENDCEILRTAGVGVAMANASQPAKDAADIVTLSNNEEGIAAALGKLLPSAGE